MKIGNLQLACPVRVCWKELPNRCQLSTRNIFGQNGVSMEDVWIHNFRKLRVRNARNKKTNGNPLNGEKAENIEFDNVHKDWAVLVAGLTRLHVL